MASHSWGRHNTFGSQGSTHKAPMASRSLYSSRLGASEMLSSAGTLSIQSPMLCRAASSHVAWTIALWSPHFGGALLERAFATSIVGPHADDFAFYFVEERRKAD
jgi:hypothetical protein